MGLGVLGIEKIERGSMRVEFAGESARIFCIALWLCAFVRENLDVPFTTAVGRTENPRGRDVCVVCFRPFARNPATREQRSDFLAQRHKATKGFGGDGDRVPASRDVLTSKAAAPRGEQPSGQAGAGRSRGAAQYSCCGEGAACPDKPGRCGLRGAFVALCLCATTSDRSIHHHRRACDVPTRRNDLRALCLVLIQGTARPSTLRSDCDLCGSNPLRALLLHHCPLPRGACDVPTCRGSGGPNTRASVVSVSSLRSRGTPAACRPVTGAGICVRFP
jgi:hypothetical protein